MLTLSRRSAQFLQFNCHESTHDSVPGFSRNLIKSVILGQEHGAGARTTVGGLRLGGPRLPSCVYHTLRPACPPTSHKHQGLLEEVRHLCPPCQLPSSLALSLALPHLFHPFVECLLFLRCSSHISHLMFHYILGKLVHVYFIYLKNFYLFILLHRVLVAAFVIFSCSMWDLVP